MASLHHSWIISSTVHTNNNYEITVWIGHGLSKQKDILFFIISLYQAEPYSVYMPRVAHDHVFIRDARCFVFLGLQNCHSIVWWSANVGHWILASRTGFVDPRRVVVSSCNGNCLHAWSKHQTATAVQQIVELPSTGTKRYILPDTSSPSFSSSCCYHAHCRILPSCGSATGKTTIPRPCVAEEGVRRHPPVCPRHRARVPGRTRWVLEA
jgi:hypothetical protein